MLVVVVEFGLVLFLILKVDIVLVKEVFLKLICMIIIFFGECLINFCYNFLYIFNYVVCNLSLFVFLKFD